MTQRVKTDQTEKVELLREGVHREPQFDVSEYPNFEKLTKYLNKKRHPRQLLQTIISLCEPGFGSTD